MSSVQSASFACALITGVLLGSSACGQEVVKLPDPFPDRKPIAATKTFKVKPADLRSEPRYKPVPGDETYICFGEQNGIFASSSSSTMESASRAAKLLEKNQITEERFQEMLEHLQDEEGLELTQIFARVKIVDVRWISGGPSAGNPIARIRFLTGPNRGKYTWMLAEQLAFPVENSKPGPAK